MEKDGLRLRVARDSLWNLSATFISKLGALIFTVIIARYLLPEGFGLYNLATSVALIFLTFADLGINQAMIRYVSLEIEKNRNKATAYFRYLLKIKIMLLIIFSLLLFILAYPLSNSIFKKQELFLPLLILSLYVFVLGLSGFFESLFYLKNKVKYIAIKEAILQSSKIILVLLIPLIFLTSQYIIGTIYSLVLTAIIVLLFVIYFSRKGLEFLFSKTKLIINKKEVLKFVVYLTLGTLSIIFFSYIDTIMLGLFVSADNIGYYKAAFTLVFGVSGLLSFVNVLMPVLTRIEISKLSDVLNKIIKYSMMLTIPATFGLIVLARYIIRFVYGYEYLSATIFLYLLSPLTILSVNIGIFYILFSARSKPEKFAKLTIIATILNVILNYLFIIYFLKISEFQATIGVAIATLISWIFYFIASIILIKKELHIRFEWVNIIKPLLASIMMFLVLKFSLSKILDLNILNGTGIVIFGILIYFIALLLMHGLNKEDLELIKKFIS